MRNSRRSEFLAGVRAELPILVGVFPFGMIYGVLAMGAGLSPVVAQAMSAIVFAGSAQFLAVQLIAGSTPWLVIVLTVFIVNLRHLLYSASVAPQLESLPARWKGWLAYLLTDEAYAVAMTRYISPSSRPAGLDEMPTPGAEEKKDARRNAHWFFFGAGLALWSTWQLSTALGIFLGAQVPASRSLDFTLPLTFIAIIVPAIIDRPTMAAATTAGLVAVLAYGLPYKLGLMAAALMGILAGLGVEAKWRSG
jgi:predicted branched-subunit amino acid permease